jgi:hypothetical protein
LDLGLQLTADGTEMFSIGSALTYIMKSVALLSRYSTVDCTMYMAHTSDDIYSPVTIYYYDLYGQNLEQILIRIPFYSDFYYHISIASKNFPASKSSPFQKF